MDKPTVLVIFGATGDLMGKKIVPALYHLFINKKLPKNFYVVAFSRRDYSQSDFKAFIKPILEPHKSEDKNLYESFFNIFSYQKGDFTKEDSYKDLADFLLKLDMDLKFCTNKLFYLAVPPQNYEAIIKNLASSNLTRTCDPNEGWTRVLIEKPFGKDLKTAEKLDDLLGQSFAEKQIYRIDHYLGKEMLQNILSFRFSNNLFTEGWNNKVIEKIEIRLLEKEGVETRGALYDGLGALRDVGQNHLLQMLSLITMSNPVNFESDEVRKKRAKILEKLKTPTTVESKKDTYRAQYLGYRKIKDIAPDSQTETYFLVAAHLLLDEWKGVPIILESGKKMKDNLKEIVITFKHVTPCLCPPGEHVQNKIVFQIEPEEKIQVFLQVKKPGYKMEVETKVFNFIYREDEEKEQIEYEKLLLDAFLGDQLLFVSTEEIRAMWKFIDPIIRAWDKNLVPLNFYKPNSSIKEIENEILE